MERTGNEKLGSRILHVPVASGTVLEEATIAVLNSNGYAAPGEKASGLTAAGCVAVGCDNSGGSDGDKSVEIIRGTFVWNNDGTITNTDLLKTCYIADKKTVTLTAEGASAAGVILAVEPDGVTVDMTVLVKDEAAVSKTSN